MAAKDVKSWRGWRCDSFQNVKGTHTVTMLNTWKIDNKRQTVKKASTVMWCYFMMFFLLQFFLAERKCFTGVIHMRLLRRHIFWCYLLTFHPEKLQLLTFAKKGWTDQRTDGYIPPLLEMSSRSFVKLPFLNWRFLDFVLHFSHCRPWLKSQVTKKLLAIKRERIIRQNESMSMKVL